MSGVAVIRYLLANSASLTAQVPAARIFAGTIPQGSALPAIGVTQISGVERRTVAMDEPPRHRQDRVQVTVLAATYPSKKTILALVRTACANQSGSVNGVKLDSILPDGEGPDLDDPAATIYEQSRDFLVRWST